MEGLAGLRVHHNGFCLIHVEFLTSQTDRELQLMKYQGEPSHIGMLMHKILITGIFFKKACPEIR